MVCHQTLGIARGHYDVKAMFLCKQSLETRYLSSLEARSCEHGTRKRLIPGNRNPTLFIMYWVLVRLIA